MSEVEIELKDEELLDFDGSDYEFDEGTGEEEENHQHQSGLGDHEFERSIRRPAESGEIQDEKEKGEEVQLDRKASSGAPGTSDRNPTRSNNNIINKPSSAARHKTDLEDGELSDMVNSKKQTERDGGAKDIRHSRKHSIDSMRSDREAERNGESRQRKRRKEHDYEKYQYISRDRKESYERHSGRYDRSDRRHDRFGAFPDPRTRGRSSHAQNFHPNLSPGIMGPGRPLGPDVNYHLRPSTAGLEIFTPAQLQELLNQEHMLRAQHMIRLGIRPPPGMYPLMNPSFLRGGSDLLPRVNFMGPPLTGPRPGSYSGAGILGGAHGRALDNEELTPSSGRGQASSREQGDHKAHHSKLPASRNKPETQTRRGEESHHHHHRQTTERERESSEVKRSGSTSGGSKTSDFSGNLINLGGPVQKSRVLIVSGLVENTPMSTVTDVFEKQGKILDFRKNQRGDVYTITYSSVQEALSAKRHLHRSILAGRQITVEYAV